MSNIDRELIHRQLEELRDYRQKLDEFYVLDRETFLGDHHRYGLAEHYLQHAIEATLDVCRHLGLALGLKTTDDAHELLRQLAGKGVLTKDFAESNAPMVGFRNVLVHEYATVDHAKVYEYLHEHIRDFDEFIRQVSQYLVGQEKQA